MLLYWAVQRGLSCQSVGLWSYVQYCTEQSDLLMCGRVYAREVRVCLSDHVRGPSDGMGSCKMTRNEPFPIQDALRILLDSGSK